jgi:hypothetical protein
MIHHVSIAVREPKRVAEAMAELMDGYCMPFPANPNSFFVFQLDDHGTEIEIYPEGTVLSRDEPTFIDGGRTSAEYTAHHFALSVTASAEKIQALAAREGWFCRRVDRAQFPVMEVWIDNTQMFEALTPEFADQYLKITADLKNMVLEQRRNASTN